MNLSNQEPKWARFLMNLEALSLYRFPGDESQASNEGSLIPVADN